MRMELKDNLKRIRKAARLSQAQLAAESGVSQQSISRLENGDDLTSKFLPSLAAALKVSPSDLDPNFVLPAGSDDELVRLVLQAPLEVKQSIALLLKNAKKPSESQ